MVTGDLVNVDNGMEIPADGFLVQSSELTSDESAMTGKILLNNYYIIIKIIIFVIIKIIIK